MKTHAQHPQSRAKDSYQLVYAIGPVKDMALGIGQQPSGEKFRLNPPSSQRRLQSCQR